MTELLDLPALAISVLRRYMRERAEQDLPVAWYSGGIRYMAKSCPDKREGAWLVSTSGWEEYYNKDRVLEKIDQANTFELI